MDDRRQGPVASWVTVAVVTAALRWLLGLGAGVLSVPPPASLSAWIGRVDPLVASFALLRALVLLGLAHLLVVTAVRAAAISLDSIRLLGVADRLTPPVLRGLVGAGLGLALAVPLPQVAVARPAGPDVPAYAVGDPSAPAMQPAPGPGVASPPRPLPLELAAVASSTGAHAAGEGADAVASSEERGGRTHVVSAGESFWIIAEQQLAAVRGRTPTDVEIVTHWRTTIASNRSRLADPSNPDLLFPGQRLWLPALDEPAGTGRS